VRTRQTTNIQGRIQDFWNGGATSEKAPPTVVYFHLTIFNYKKLYLINPSFEKFNPEQMFKYGLLANDIGIFLQKVWPLHNLPMRDSALFALYTSVSESS
jgi:hypothetical protein